MSISQKIIDKVFEQKPELLEKVKKIKQTTNSQLELFNLLMKDEVFVSTFKEISRNSPEGQSLENKDKIKSFFKYKKNDKDFNLSYTEFKKENKGEKKLLIQYFFIESNPDIKMEYENYIK